MKYQIQHLEEENRTLRERLSEVTMIADDEKQSIEHILELEEENKKLKEENKNLKDAMKELNNYNKFRIQENERLREELNKKGMETWFDEKAENIYISQKENILM